MNSWTCPSPLRTLGPSSRKGLLPTHLEESQQFFAPGDKHSLTRELLCQNPASVFAVGPPPPMLSPLMFISHWDITAGHCH